MLTSKLVAKIGDLGVAKVVRAGSKETISKFQLTRAVPGTPDFMPPEVMEVNAAYGASIDVFSFGGIALYVFSEEWPTPSCQKMRDPATKKLRALTEPERRQPYLDKMTGKVAGLKKMVEQCLDDDPEERPTIQEVSKIMESLRGFGYALQSQKYQIEWTKSTDLPTAMYGAYATVIKTKLYIGGGWCPYDNNNIFNVYVYELDKNQWSVLPPLQQYYGIPVNIDNQLTAIGGKQSTTNQPTAQVTTFANSRWNNTYPNLSVARSEPAVVPYDRYVIVAGGEGDDEIAMNTIEVLDVTGRHWMNVNTHLPQPMYSISATICGDFFTIVGYNGTDSKSFNGTYKIPIDEIISPQQQTQQPHTSSTDKGNNKWHQLAVAPYRRTTVVPDTSPPVIIGGSKQGNTVNNIAIFDDKNNSWKNIASVPINCAWATVAVINDSIIVMGGASVTKAPDTCKTTALSDVNVGRLVELLCD